MSTIDQRMKVNDLVNGNGYGVDGNKNKSLLPKPDQVVYLASIEEADALPGFLGILAGKTIRLKGWYSATVAGVKTLYVV